MTSLFRSRRTGQGANAHHPAPAPRRKASRMLCWSLVAALAGGVGWGATHLHTTQSSALQGKPDTVAIAAASTAHDGIAAVDLEQIVAASDSVYALAANHQAVYEWSPDQNNWLKVRGATQKLYAGGDSVYAIATGSGDITKYSGEPGDWPRIGGPGATFAATTKHLYGISTNGSMVMEYSGRGETWKKVGDRAKDLYAGPDSTLYATNPDTGNIYKYDGKWSAVGGPGATFAVTDNNFYGLTPDRTSVVEYDADKKKWRTVGGPAGNIFASNTLYATDRGGDLYKYNGRPGLWNRLSGPAAAFATNGNLLYRLAPDHRSVQKYTGNGATEKWTTLGAPAAGPAPSRAEKTARFKSMNQSGDESRKVWTTANDEHLRGVPDPFEFRWSTNYCNVVRDIPFQEYDFRNACARHDFLSRNYRDMYGEQAFLDDPDGQRHIDTILRDDMLETCKDRFPGSQQLCQSTAMAYYKGVAAVSAVPHSFIVDIFKGLGGPPPGARR